MSQKAKLFAFTTLLSLLTAASCTQDSAVSDSIDAQIQVKLYPENIWTSVSTPQTRGDTGSGTSTETSAFALYLFDSSGTRLCTQADEFSSSTLVSKRFNQILSSGTYTFYGVTDWLYSTASNYFTITSADSILPLTLSDIHLGKDTLAVNATEKSYSVSVTASPIMSKLELIISGVPQNITSITATLPEQATSFTLGGTVSGKTNSQTLSFTQGAKTNGYYTWSTTETLVYPVADGCTSMPIHIVCSDGTRSICFSTTSAAVCSKGKRVYLTASYTGITATAGITESVWGTDSISSSIDLGDGTIQ